MDTIDNPFREIISRLDGVEGRGDQRQARCPAHDDSSPSLSVSKGDPQPVVLHCHAGCTDEEILSALGLSWGDLLSGDQDCTESEFERAPWTHGELASEYKYRGADGQHTYTIRRYQHPRGWKTFRPYEPGVEYGPGLDDDTDRVLYRLPHVLDAAQEGDVVLLVEGEKDVETLEREGFTATTSGASDSWKDRFSQSLAGAKVAIVPDNDEAGTEFATEAANSLLGAAEWVRVVDLEDVPDSGGDVTDWFARGHSAAELRDRVKGTPNYEESAEFKAATESGSNGPGPKQGERNPSKRPQPQAQGDGASPDPELDASAPDPWSAIRATYVDSSKSARLEAAQQVVHDLSVATDRRTGECYVWDEEEQVLESGGDQRIGELLLRELREQHSIHEQKEITEKVHLLTARDSFGGDFVPVRNGDLFFDGATPRLEEVDPDRGPLVRSPAAWDPSADTSGWEGYLANLMPSQSERDTLQEMAGYALMHWGLPFHKALFVTGPTASGKSTTLQAIQNLYPDETVANSSPQQLVNGRFGAAALEGAWANFRSDLDDDLVRDVGLFKELVAGDPIYAERKFEQGFKFRPTAKHFYSCNRLPEIDLDDDAFYRRILLVSFPTTIPRENRTDRSKIDELLWEDRDAIMTWAVEGLSRLLANGGFSQDRSPEDTRRRWESRSSSVGRFKSAYLQITGESEDFETKDSVYSYYAEFCDDQGLGTSSKQELTQALTQDPKIGQAQRTPKGSSRQFRCYTGVQLNRDAPF